MCDLWSLYYFSPAEQKFLRRIPTLLSRLGERYSSIDPVDGSAFGGVAQVLTGFLPLDAVLASIHVGQKGGTFVEIQLQGPRQPLKITVRPRILPETLFPALQVLQIHPGDRSVTSSQGGMNLALNLFELMARRNRAIEDLVINELNCDWVNFPQASSYWRKRAAAAKLAGALPPRAIHWMASPHEDSED